MRGDLPRKSVYGVDKAGDMHSRGIGCRRKQEGLPEGGKMATQKQVKAFIEMIAPIAQEKSKGRVLPSVCIAQACCESAYGTSLKMVRANALFGIKVGKAKAHFGSAWKDKAYSTSTKECYDGKTYVGITDMFRAYDSVEEAVEDYCDMLSSCSRYRACVGEKDPYRCITAIKNGGYATSPTYVGTIMCIINKYNLTQYDAGAASRSVLRMGARGEQVRELQTLLAKEGHPLTADGIFGTKTKAAVMAFQENHGLAVDGLCGANTWTELQERTGIRSKRTELTDQTHNTPGEGSI